MIFCDWQFLLNFWAKYCIFLNLMKIKKKLLNMTKHTPYLFRQNTPLNYEEKNTILIISLRPKHNPYLLKQPPPLFIRTKHIPYLLRHKHTPYLLRQKPNPYLLRQKSPIMN